MWQTANWRKDAWENINQPWDMVIIGGGITGAGILREAARLGMKVLMVEQRDFAWGTSSRSSKFVHGGLRYLAQGQFKLMLHSVQERERLLSEGKGLVSPLGFLIPKQKSTMKNMVYRTGLTVYDLMAMRMSHKVYNRREFEMLAPHISKRDLYGGFRYLDAQVDDSRLVLRVIGEALELGATALNYVSAQTLIREEERVVGLELRDAVTGQTASVRASVIVNATGAWSDQLRQQLGEQAKLRPLRGSHLVFPSWRLPVAQAVSFNHPWDGRHVFVTPWEGVTLVGTTDIDHNAPLNDEPHVTGDEAAYLMAAADYQFPGLNLTLDDVLSTFSGVRPVINSGKEDPSAESRDHVIWNEHGLVTVTGGKLTTFRVIALDALKEIHTHYPHLPAPDPKTTSLEEVDVERPENAHKLTDAQWARLVGRYERFAAKMVKDAAPDELDLIEGTNTHWIELRWCARAEGVVHLEDLLLRRTRLGLLIRQGGLLHMERIRALCQSELGWDDARWMEEQDAYARLWTKCYSLPKQVPEWQKNPAEQTVKETKTRSRLNRKTTPLLIGGMLTAAWLIRRKAKAY